MKINRIYISVIIGLLLSAASYSQSCWSGFRGDQAFSGRTDAELPSKLSLLWNFKTGESIKGAPVVCNDIIVVGSFDGNAYGITMEGGMKWKINTGNGIEAPALIDGDKAYVANLDGRVMALELTTGRTLWAYSTEGQIMGAPNIWKDGDNEVLIIGSYDYYLHGIDAKTGAGLWKYEADNFLNGAPAIWEGVAVFGGCDGLIHQVNVKDGSLKKRQTVATYVAGSVAVENWITWVGDYDGKFTCLDLESGEERWVFDNADTEQPFIAAPALSADKVFTAGRDKYVYAFNKKDGSLVWKVSARGQVDASPVLIGDKLLIATMRGDLMLLNTNDGSTFWSYELGSPITGNPAVIDGHIIVGSDDGRVYCFGKK